jgi:uncharacterized membrane protein
MSDLVAISFEDAQQADRMLESLKALEKEGLVKLEDASVVVRDADGKVSYRTTEPLPGAGTGALVGGAWGLLFGAILFVPLVGLAAGAAAGALAGLIGKDSMDESFKQGINDELRPNTSMLFIRANDKGHADQLLERLRASNFQGKILRTNLSQADEKLLQDALGPKAPPPAAPPSGTQTA